MVLACTIEYGSSGRVLSDLPVTSTSIGHVAESGSDRQFPLFDRMSFDWIQQKAIQRVKSKDVVHVISRPERFILRWGWAQSRRRRCSRRSHRARAQLPDNLFRYRFECISNTARARRECCLSARSGHGMYLTKPPSSLCRLARLVRLPRTTTLYSNLIDVLARES